MMPSMGDSTLQTRLMRAVSSAALADSTSAAAWSREATALS